MLVTQSCPTFCDPKGYSLPGSSVSRILQARILAAAAAKSLQPCPTLCDPGDGSPPGSAIPGILQARTRVGCHFLLQCINAKSENEVTQSCPNQLLVTLWTTAYQAPPSVGFSRQECWSGLPLPSPRLLECVAIFFSRGSSQSSHRTWVFCITGRFFTS